MAGERVPPASFPAELPEIGRQVRPLRPDEQSQTLVAKLSPLVDKLRQLYTKFGIRPYRVFLVHQRWSGGRRGDGAAVELSRVEILPTPHVVDMGGTSEVLRAAGLTEEGGISVDQVSTKYAEDDLMGRVPELQDPADPRTSQGAVEFFWEVVENRPNEPTAVRRRYVPNAAPTISRDGFQWKVSLTRQDYERARSGSARRGAF